MIHLIIPSYRRPAQLYLLLESIRRFSKEFKITVLNKFDQEYSNGYNLCTSDFDINLCVENVFRDDILYLIEGSTQSVAIACDDNVLFREVPRIEQIEKGNVYSLRLGANVCIQNYVNGERLPFPNRVVYDGYIIGDEMYKVMSWNPAGHGYYNWEYPFSLDFHIYNSKQLLDLASQIDFHNTNTLEGNLMRFKDRILTMHCPTLSCSVNWPLNNMSGLTASQNISTEELNQKFMDGYKISLDRIVKENIIGCHQILPLEWTKR